MPEAPLRISLPVAILAALAAACGPGAAGPADAGTLVVGRATNPPSGVIDAGTPGPSDAGAGSACMASGVLSQLGRPGKLLVGADMTDSVAALAPFDIRYLYLAGGLADGDGTCSSCGSCTAAGVSCSTGCGWWGCWQDPATPPGQYLRDLLAKAGAAGMLPLVSYYEILQTSHVVEGSAEIVALQDAALLRRWFNDWRFVLQQIGNRAALLHLEPDLWGYAEKMNADPRLLAAAVTASNPTDCAGQQDSLAGLGRCAIAMVRKYAPGARVGLHASAWGSGIVGTDNRDPAVDMRAQGQRVADFLLACGGGDADFVVVEASDRDAGYYGTLGKNTFWDASNATLPSFHQAFSWATALTERMGRPALWWQLPVGNMSLPDTANQWRDNRVDYFLQHPAEVAQTHAFGMVFGAGESHQTNPSTDGGNLVRRVQQLAAAGGQPACQ